MNPEMFKKIPSTFLFLVFFTISFSSYSVACDKEDFINFVASDKGCIGIQALKEFDESKSNFVVFLHGDYTQKKENYAHRTYGSFTENLDTTSANIFLMARPGYTTASGNKSSGGDKRGNNLGDNYIWKRDIKPVGHAIQNLKDHYKPDQLIVIGQSGGAATTGILIGRFPGLIDSAFLVACPCYVKEWRQHRVRQRGKVPTAKNTWPRSDSPNKHVEKISPNTNVHIIVGEEDENTLPKFSKKYYARIKDKNENVKATLEVVPGEGHSSVLKNGDVAIKINKVIAGKE